MVKIRFMNKPVSAEEARDYVTKLLGKKVSLKVNKGRNRVKEYSGCVSEVYGNVFVVKLFDDLFDRLSCSYVDVVCGEIKLKESATLHKVAEKNRQ